LLFEDYYQIKSDLCFRKYDEEDRYSSKHKKTKKHKYKDRDDSESLLTEDQIKKELVEST